MKKNKKNFIISLLVMLTLLLSACGGGEKSSSKASTENGEYTFKLSTIVDSSHTWVETAKKFKEELQKRSDGRMDVEIYPSSQLGTEADMVQQMQSGAIDFGFITSAYLATRTKELNAWFMPFLFEDISDAIKMRNSDNANELLGLLNKQGLVGMDWLFTGSHSILMKSGVMDNPDAFKGKKIRAPGGEVINDFYTELGASPITMPLTEVYQGLQTGVVDGVNASADSAYSQKFHEVGKEFTLLNQFAFNAAVVMSKSNFESLSKEDQMIVKDAMKVAIDYGNELAIKDTEEHLALLKKEGLNIHQPSDLTAFEDAKNKIYDKYSSKVPFIKKFIKEAQSK